MTISWNENGRSFTFSCRQKEVLRYIPKKLLPHVQEAFRNSDGYWIVFDSIVDANYDSLQSCGIIHEYTIRELRKRLKKCSIYAFS